MIQFNVVPPILNGCFPVACTFERLFKLIAVGSGMVSSVIFQVPNQPIYFFDDWWIENGQSHGRKEDQACFQKLPRNR